MRWLPASVLITVVFLLSALAGGCFGPFFPAPGETERPTPESAPKPPPDGEIFPPEEPVPPPEPPCDLSPAEEGPAEEGEELEWLPELESDISEVIEEAEGRYGVYFRLLDEREETAEIEIRADEAFFAASCYKVALSLFLYELAEAGEIDLDEPMVYEEEHEKSGAGILKDEEPGDAYGLRHLASLAIIHSDNSAAHMLLDRLGREAFEEYQIERGARQVCIQDNLASPRDIALFLTEVLGRAEEQPEPFGEILDWLEEAYPRDRIPAGVPGGVTVASKTGTWPGTFNDAAAVLADDHPFLLVVMSEEVPSYEVGSATIAEIAEMIYDRLEAISATDE